MTWCAVLNAKKSKCLIFEPTHNMHKAGSFTTPKPLFYIGGNVIHIVNHWPQLGRIIDNRSNDGADILYKRNAMVGSQINNVLCYSNQVGSVPKLKLLKSCRSNLNCCELWILFHDAISDFVKHGIKVYREYDRFFIICTQLFCHHCVIQFL